MKHAPNWMPYPDQAEGWLTLKEHTAGNIPTDKTIIIINLSSQSGDIFFAKIVRQEPGCSYMQTLDGRNFRITTNSSVQAFSSYFDNQTDKDREGAKLKNFWLNLTPDYEPFLKFFMGDVFKFYILWDNTEKTFCRYYEKEKRSDMKWAAVAGSFVQTHITMTDRGFVGG